MDHLCFLGLVLLMLSRLFIDTLWSPAGKRADLMVLIGDIYCPMWYPGSGVVPDCIVF